MFDWILMYACSCLGAYVVQQGDTWLSLFNWKRFLKTLAWPLVLVKPLILRFLATRVEQPDSSQDPRWHI